MSETRAGVENPRAKQRALAVGISPGGDADGILDELKELLRTAGVATAGEMVQTREEPDPDRYFGRGKLEELKEAIGRAGANLVATDDELAPRQERNLEKALGVPVIDRTAVILDIFADHANTAEGKLQVELAQLEYDVARLRGLWTHLDSLAGGVGTRGGSPTRGPGERQIEIDRRLARDRISSLRRELEKVRRTRDTMRARRASSALPQVALAGYTNAGKSTLLNALTGAEVGVGDRLFHTLDPTTRAYEHDGRRYLITDTVGFIRKLPHDLVEAFKATLEETVRADLIVHVVDASEDEESRAAAIAAVNGVLEEIGADEAPRLLALNKVDLLDERGARPSRDLESRRGARLRRGADRPRRSARRDRRRPSRRRCARSRCSCPTTPATASPSSTTSPAGSSARTGPRACSSRPGSRRRWRTASRTSRRNGTGRRRPLIASPRWSCASPSSRRHAAVPARAHGDDAGLDLTPRRRPGSSPASAPSVGTGLAVEIPTGHAGLVLPRSGLAAKHGIALVNAPGPDRPRLPRRAPRPAAQHRPRTRPSRSSRATASPSSCWSPFVPAAPVEVAELDETERGLAGFGSSGR